MRHSFYPFLALFLAGCAPSVSRFAPDSPDRPWAPSVDSSGTLLADPRKGHGVSADGYVLPSNPAAAVMPSAPEVDQSRVYELVDLIDLAERTNPETRIAWNDARNAALAAGMTRSAYLPRLTATVLDGYQTNSSESSSHGQSVNGKGSANGTLSTLSLQWLLFDFGQRDALVEAADQGSVIANIGFTAAHQRLIHTVSLAFYAYSAASARAASAAASLKDAEDIQTASEARKAQGIGTLVEVTQARQFTAQARLSQVRAKGEVKDLYASLLSAIGVSPLANLRIADISQRALPANLDGSIDSVLSNALSRRPDVLAAVSAEKAAQAGVRAARADFLPKFFVSASGGYTSGDINVSAIPGIGGQSPTVNLSNSRWGSTVLGGISVPIYDAGLKRAALAQARNRAESASEALKRAKVGASQEVVVANSRLRTSLEALAANQAVLEASQTAYDAAFESFRSGVGTSTDVHAAERQLLEARNELADVRSGVLSAAATLALACGSLGKAP